MSSPHCQRDLGIIHPTVAVTHPEVGATGHTLRRDEDRPLVSGARRHLGHDHQSTFDLEDLRLQPECRCHRTGRQGNDVVTMLCSVGEPDHAEAGAFVNPEHHGAAGRVGECHERLEDGLGKAPCATLHLDLTGLTSHAPEEIEELSHVHGVHARYFTAELFTCQGQVVK